MEHSAGGELTGGNGARAAAEREGERPPLSVILPPKVFLLFGKKSSWSPVDTKNVKVYVVKRGHFDVSAWGGELPGAATEWEGEIPPLSLVSLQTMSTFLEEKASKYAL